MDFDSQPGKPHPLGCHSVPNGTQFALHAPAASQVDLAIGKDLYPMHKTKKVWHLIIKDLPSNTPYTYRLTLSKDTVYIFDPFNPFMDTPSKWGQTAYKIGKVHSLTHQPHPFDWGKVASPAIPLNQLIIYEMHIRGFTMDPSSQSKQPGTFQGAIEKIHHLKSLGVNAIELLPIQEFNESELDRKDLTNYWGYSTVNFFAIMNRYLSNPAHISEFKSFVKELHANQIEIILDVVYNHTGPSCPLFHCDPSYYIIEEGEHTNYTGCGNTLYANGKAGEHLIIESLRYLAQEFHIDGFRFDLASTLTRDTSGAPMDKPPIIKAMIKDPILSKLKLISEPWDPGGLYQVGEFPLPFADWNGAYRDVARSYLGGFDVDMHAVQDVIQGSPSLFQHKPPEASINFVTVHDGFTLKDLVSYESKHNEANLEDNQDGSDSNLSINFGTEGPSSELEEIRQRHSANFLIFLMLSYGTPMILMGDELGKSHLGNNNPWCQDSPLNWIQWDQVDESLFTFTQKLIAFRKSLTCFSTRQKITFHQEENSRAMSFVIQEKRKKICVVFNPTESSLKPTLPPHKKGWRVLADTSSPLANSFPAKPHPELPSEILPYTAWILVG